MGIPDYLTCLPRNLPVFIGLEEPPTECGVPLSFTAKSMPPSVLVKLQGSLHKCNATPAEFFIKDLQTPLEVPGPPLQGRDLLGVYSPHT